MQVYISFLSNITWTINVQQNNFKTVFVLNRKVQGFHIKVLASSRDPQSQLFKVLADVANTCHPGFINLTYTYNRENVG